MGIITIKRRVPIVGNIGLGEKQVSSKGKEYPVNRQYFVLPRDGESGYEHIKMAVDAGLLPPKPQALDIRFPSDEIELVFNAAKRYHTGTMLQCKGDGETGWWSDPEAGLVERKCVGCAFAESGKCRDHAYLLFTIAQVPTLGAFRLSTNSLYAIENFGTMLEMALDAFGRLRRIPFRLLRVPINTVVDGKPGTNWSVKLEMPAMTIEQMQAIAQPLTVHAIGYQAIEAPEEGATTVEPEPAAPEPTEAEKNKAAEDYIAGARTLDQLINRCNQMYDKRIPTPVIEKELDDWLKAHPEVEAEAIATSMGKLRHLQQTE